MPNIHRHYSENTVTISYPMREALQTITAAEYRLIRNTNNKVAAIKFIRDQYSLGLYEAKTIVDTIFNAPDLS